eukprot:403348854
MRLLANSLLSLTILATINCQQIGNVKQNHLLPMSIQECDTSGCQAKQLSVTMDANWRWAHNVGGYDACGKDTKYCPDESTCAQNCALDGIEQNDWKNTYGIESVNNNNGISMQYVTGGNVGSRTYLVEGDSYKVFNLKNSEFSVDVDMSQLPCGVNGALYLVEMDQHGGSQPGAKYGTGYCDAQCPKDVKWIQGQANFGKSGACCAEMDIWEANQFANAVTPHPCNFKGLKKCSGSECDGSGICDKSGCDINPYRIGQQDFFGPGSHYKVDTSKPFTVVTQFITADGTYKTDVVEIKRHFVQNGKKITLPQSNIQGLSNLPSDINDKYCHAQTSVFKNENTFSKVGGMKAMSDALGRGMVLVMSIWDDPTSRMLWLDSSFPLNVDEKQPGIKRGPCATNSGEPGQTRGQHGNAKVFYSNIQVGTINSTKVHIHSQAHNKRHSSSHKEFLN